MLKKRVIPKLLLKKTVIGGKERAVIVTTRAFGEVKVVGDLISQGKIYESQSVDELLLLDLDATGENRMVSPALVEKISSEIFMPLTVGGGISSVDDFRRVLLAGADKVGINAAALMTPELITDAAFAFGSQCVVVSIDYRTAVDGTLKVVSNRGKTETEWDPLCWAQRVQELGAGEIILTSVERDGMRAGLDLATLKEVTSLLSIPVIASGGVGSTQNFIDGFLVGQADAVAAGTFFAFKDENPYQTRAQIRTSGIPIR